MANLHILGFSGSLRKKSYNSAGLREAQTLVPEGAELEIFELDALPPFNQDYENDPPEPVRIFKEKIRQADALLMAVPEYNYSFSGVLKNAIDWASRPITTTPMRGKPTAIMGFGGKYGTVRAQLQLRQVFLFLDTPVLMKPEVYVINAWEKFDSEGNLIDEPTRQQVATLLQALVEWTHLHTRL